MDIVSLGRILRDSLFREGLLRQPVRNLQRNGQRIRTIISSRNSAVARYVVRDLWRYLVGVRPVVGETRMRARAAVDWLLRAQDATGDGGVSQGYFPADRKPGWRASYPETTGYIITSMLEFARRNRDDGLVDRARRMADWEIAVQMPSGAVQGGTVTSPDKQTPAVFNTGMVLDGLASICRVTRDEKYRAAGTRAADFLMGDMDAEGHFCTHGTFVDNTRIKTYNSLCALALYRFGAECGRDDYQQAAVRSISAAVAQQTANGWFDNNCFSRIEAPFVHSIGYTLQAILEVGILENRDDFIDAARRGIDPLLRCMSRKGYVAGRFYSDWRPALLSSCLTGSAQLAVVCYQLAGRVREPSYRAAADRLVNYLKALQTIDSTNAAINGALAGSFPFFGDYMTAGFPNWATKFFLDALMLQDQAQEG